MITPLQAQEMQARVSRNKLRDAPPAEGCSDESELHNQIIAECNRLGWICFHGSMAHRARRVAGEPDCIIAASDGRTFYVEAKTRTGKLTTEQQGVITWLMRLGHKPKVIRSFDEFLAMIREEGIAVKIEKI